MKKELFSFRKHVTPFIKNVMFKSYSTAPPEVEMNVNNVALRTSARKHLIITAKNTRLPVMSNAVVTDVRKESPTVKGITLKVENPHFIFKAGQWIDMFIPGMETVGGFSMYSCPSQLRDKGTIDLGIKFSKWPPAFWIHNECKIGSSVKIQAGGDFYYAPDVGDPVYDLLLIAGGVGVNPLASMAIHASNLYKLHQQNCEEYCPGKIKLLYSAKTYEELLHKNILDSISRNTPNIDVIYFTTRCPPESSTVKHGHIKKEDLKSALDTLNMSNLKAFICGPPPMIEKISEYLLSIGLSQDQVLYEKWW